MDGAPRHGRPFPGLEPQREIDCRIMTRKLLGQILVEQGVVTEDTVNKALTYQKGKKMRVGEALIALGSCDEEAVTKALATQARLPYVDLRKGKISEEFTRLATREAVEQHRFIPLLEKAGKLVIAIDDPLRVFELDNLGFILNRDLAPALASPTSLRAKMREVYGIGEENTVAKLVGGNADSESEDAPIIRMVQKMIACKIMAADRSVCGSASTENAQPSAAGRAASPRSASRRGRISPRSRHPRVDPARQSRRDDGHASARPTARPGHELEELGFDPGDYASASKSIIRRPNGIFLVTGPDGLRQDHDALRIAERTQPADVKIITAEDPVEYQLARRQPVPGAARASACRSRDPARHAASGAEHHPGRRNPRPRNRRDRDPGRAHRSLGVLDAAHQRRAVGVDAPRRHGREAVPRVGVRAGVSCACCAASAARILKSVGLQRSQLPPHGLYRPEGCPQCDMSGYRGRKGVYELLELDSGLRDLVFRGQPHSAIRERAKATGRMSTLLEDGVRKVVAGLTTIPEILRIAHALE
jgi:type IV pilus assembly protein PilB